MVRGQGSKTKSQYLTSSFSPQVGLNPEALTARCPFLALEHSLQELACRRVAEIASANSDIPSCTILHTIIYHTIIELIIK